LREVAAAADPAPRRVTAAIAIAAIFMAFLQCPLLAGNLLAHAAHLKLNAGNNQCSWINYQQ
jgi:hypothetical protein